MVENGEIHDNAPRISRRSVLIGAVVVGVGLPVAGMVTQELIRAANKTEINRGNMPQAVQQHYNTEYLLSKGLAAIEPEVSTQTPDVWRASSISFWSDDKVNGGAVVEYSTNTYGLMTTTEALGELEKTGSQTFVFIPGLEIDDVATAEKNPLFDHDIAAFKSKAFSKVYIEHFQQTENKSVVILPLPKDMSQAIAQAKVKGYIQPLQLSQQTFQKGELLGGARFDRGTDTRYQVNNIGESGITITWADPHFGDAVEAWTSIREDDSHFRASRLGDAVVPIHANGDLTPQLAGFVGRTVSITEYSRGKSSEKIETAKEIQVIKAPLLK